MIDTSISEIVTDDLKSGAILHYHEPFINDYLVLHCLLRKYEVKSVFEVGCNEGVGTNIICNAVYPGGVADIYRYEVYSLDLPDELADISKQHPVSEGKGKNKVGHKCNFPFVLISEDSLTYTFSEHPCEAYFIDGEHDFQHPYRESTQIFSTTNPKIVIWHDADMDEVGRAINEIEHLWEKDYNFYRVANTRIAFAVKK